MIFSGEIMTALTPSPYDFGHLDKISMTTFDACIKSLFHSAYALVVSPIGITPFVFLVAV